MLLFSLSCSCQLEHSYAGWMQCSHLEELCSDMQKTCTEGPSIASSGILGPRYLYATFCGQCSQFSPCSLQENHSFLTIAVSPAVPLHSMIILLQQCNLLLLTRCEQRFRISSTCPHFLNCLAFVLCHKNRMSQPGLSQMS